MDLRLRHRYVRVVLSISAVWDLVESETTLYSIPERQYVHFKHKDFLAFLLHFMNCTIFIDSQNDNGQCYDV